MLPIERALLWRESRVAVCLLVGRFEIRHMGILGMSWSARVESPRPLEQMAFSLGDYKRHPYRRSRRRHLYQNS